MSNPIQNLLERRASANSYDTSRSLPDEEIAELIRLATLAPTSFNFQNWRFIAVRSSEAKARLRAVAFDQHQVTEAAVTVIICGTLDPQRAVDERLAPAVEAGIMSPEFHQTWVGIATRLYAGNSGLQRDEAIRSGAFAAMSLMLAATGAGLASGPMIGFDPAGVAREFGLGDDEVPVLLLTVGHATPKNWPQKPRRPVGEVLSFI